MVELIITLYIFNLVLFLYSFCEILMGERVKHDKVGFINV